MAAGLVKRVLFIRHPMRTIGGTGIYTLMLMSGLRRLGYVVGIWPTDACVYLDDFKKNHIHCYRYSSRSIPMDWDAVVVQHSQTLSDAKKILPHLARKPFIFVAHSTLCQDQIVPFSDLYRVIAISEPTANSLQRWGIPQEIVDVVHNPVAGELCPLRPRRNGQFELLLVCRLDYDKLDLVRQIVAAINQMPECHLRIVGGGNDRFVKECANANTEIVGGRLDLSMYYRDADLVLGSGRTAVEATAWGRPVVIVGSRGLAGMLTPDNYPTLSSTMFAGRPGGDLFETFPPTQLVSEIRRVQRSSTLDQLVSINRSLVMQDYDEEKIASTFAAIVDRAISLSQAINDGRRFCHLAPKLATNCELVETREGNEHLLLRSPLSKVVAEVGLGRGEALKRFDGVATIEDCYSKSGLSSQESFDSFMRFARLLWDSKAIIIDVDRGSPQLGRRERDAQC